MDLRFGVEQDSGLSLGRFRNVSMLQADTSEFRYDNAIFCRIPIRAVLAIAPCPSTQIRSLPLPTHR